MVYTEDEVKTLNYLKRADFKNLNKLDVINMFKKLRPEVVTKMLEQVPKLAEVVRASINDYKDVANNVIDGDNESLKQFFSAVEKITDNTAMGSRQLYEYVMHEQESIDKQLEICGFESEEGKQLLKRKGDLDQLIADHEYKTREFYSNLATMADHKDTEKRQFNLDFLMQVGSVIFAFLMVVVAAMGGNIHVGSKKS